MTNFLLVGVGGGVGAMARYWLSTVLQSLFPTAWPVGTLGVNVLGCFIIGGLAYLAEARGLLTPETRALTMTGFLGGFTTFSTFGNETLALMRGGENPAALLNVGAHLGLGLGAVWAGRALAAWLWR